jgi:hypothetical protein
MTECPYCGGEWIIGNPMWDDEGRSVIRSECSICGAREEHLRFPPDQELVDELVIEAKLKEASDLNNKGWEAQLAWLKENGFL